ncbi:Ccdc96 [Symbiodinium natans]|uniref:Ccdc96 protein n=1 Tax=Symbiodinium natans TaxID=878477 RepID=A0A812MD52_9DINO|nr:Ccdc96 [Symbiodinium natans]
MREKVQFVQKEYQILKEELAQLDQDLGAQRDLVTKTKHERDEHRQEYASLKQQTGIMNSEHLTKDFKDRADRIKELKDQITQLKKRHGQMSQRRSQIPGCLVACMAYAISMLWTVPLGHFSQMLQAHVRFGAM